MPRLSFPDLDHTSDSVRGFFDGQPTALSIFRMIAHAKNAFGPWLNLMTAVMTSNAFDTRTREIVICMVTHQASPDYEYVYHRYAAHRAGVSKREIAALADGSYDKVKFSKRDLAVIRFTDEVLKQIKATDEAVEQLRSHCSDEQIVELLFLIGLYSMNARIAANTGIALGDDEVSGGSQDIVSAALAFQL